jgi:hypothetical protein
MIPADIDPSLCTAEPLLESLDDGFSPPPRADETQQQALPASPLPTEPALGTKSPF